MSLLLGRHVQCLDPKMNASETLPHASVEQRLRTWVARVDSVSYLVRSQVTSGEPHLSVLREHCGAAGGVFGMSHTCAHYFHP